MKKVRRAIISVTDKEGVVEFATKLAGLGVEIISTGGTGKMIQEAGVNVIPIGSYTGFPEMLDGRLKTLHPKIHGGILGIRGNDEHEKEMTNHGIPPIDMVVVNLYAFEKTIAGGCTMADAIENIDIGGPTMIRAAAKNYSDVAVVTDTRDYDAIIEEMEAKGSSLSNATRLKLAKKVFALTARYDGAISNYLGTMPEVPEVDERVHFPETASLQYSKIQDLRYGENPHQKAAFYASSGTGLAGAVQLHGKDLSFNNILDVDAALSISNGFSEPAVAIIKHNNPCGAAVSTESVRDAYLRALECDSTSAFGGIVGINRTVTLDVAEELNKIFLEAVIAPAFDPDALKVLKGKKNLRLMATGEAGTTNTDVALAEYDIKRVAGGVLFQSLDTASASELKTASERSPSEEELKDLLFAWNICRHVKSNAIILASGSRTVGIGAGQMSRIDSTQLAFMKAANAGLEVKGSVLASDAFFPFRDNVDLAAEKGVRAIIQPGGSIRDDEVIAAANEHGIAMLFTGIRHFRH
ncbi:MAG: bifunctional phosphoribosylaminoimidazolecarboxamide formyltransferase/IMP cyclohydrolase [Proteobacteria bacterium]|nr:bifunctional phosphoribosylaminoimidazolecarboxamide formyltransferase/IMP cyclohydrolase [Pseudomonadota bacterium]